MLLLDDDEDELADDEAVGVASLVCCEEGEAR